MTKNYEIIS
jgi:hypothetical protein